jgi:hypothetical protein
LRFQTEPPPQERKFKRRGAVRKNSVLSRMSDVVPVLLRFRPCLLSVYASLAVRFSAGALLRLSPGHGSYDPLSWQSRFVKYPVGRIFSCCFGKKIPSLGRARERTFSYPLLKLFYVYGNGFSISREQMTSPLTLYSTLFLSFSVCPHLYRNENRGLTPSSSKNSQNVYNLNAKNRPTQLSKQE